MSLKKTTDEYKKALQRGWNIHHYHCWLCGCAPKFRWWHWVWPIAYRKAAEAFMLRQGAHVSVLNDDIDAIHAYVGTHMSHPTLEQVTEFVNDINESSWHVPNGLWPWEQIGE